MASACVNNVGIMSPENFLDCSSSAPCHSYGWLSPRISFSRDFSDGSSPPSSNLAGPISKQPTPPPPPPPARESEIRDPDLELLPVSEFEFRLQDPVALMLPADELFFDGKLVPLQVSSIKPTVNGLKSTRCVSSPDTATQSRRRVEEDCSADPYLFSPKAPRCSSRWRELLGLKKLYQSNNGGGAKSENNKTTSSSSSSSYFSEANSKALKYFLHRSSKSSLSSSFDSSLSLPLLKDSDSESISLPSSRVSLSSSSSGHEHEDLHRLSLDYENKPNTNPISLHRNPNNNNNPPRMRQVKPRPKSESNPRSTTMDHHPTTATRLGRSPMRRTAGESTSRLAIRGVSVDSPRMNSSGKIVFHNLERSSSSPSSFNGGPKFKNRGGGMERSYSANVRVTPVLNVPVCSSLRGSSKSVSVFGFGQLFTSTSTSTGGSSRNHHSYNSSSTNRTTTTRRIIETDGGGKFH